MRNNPAVPIGYVYYPYHKINVKEFSSYVETGNVKDVDYIPDYAFYSSFEDRWRWRDLYPYGYVDSEGVGVDYPFLNGAHYPFKEIKFYQMSPQRRFNTMNMIVQPIIDNCE